jgi:uncharacterized protein
VRKRIGLSMKLDASAPRRDGDRPGRDNRFEPAGRTQRGRDGGHTPAAGGSAMASAFAKLQGFRR